MIINDVCVCCVNLCVTCFRVKLEHEENVSRLVALAKLCLVETFGPTARIYCKLTSLLDLVKARSSLIVHLGAKRFQGHPIVEQHPPGGSRCEIALEILLRTKPNQLHQPILDMHAACLQGPP